MKYRMFLALAAAGFAAACTQKPASTQVTQVELKPIVEARLQPNLQPPPQIVIPSPVATVEKPRELPQSDSNSVLAERVRRALEDESRIHAAAIDVTAAGGTVTLWGTAASDDERARATRVAARIVGVKWVNNKLVIAAGS